MGRKKIQISRIMDERNRQVIKIAFLSGFLIFWTRDILSYGLKLLQFGQLGNKKLRLRLRNENLA